MHKILSYFDFAPLILNKAACLGGCFVIAHGLNGEPDFNQRLKKKEKCIQIWKWPHKKTVKVGKTFNRQNFRLANFFKKFFQRF